MKKKKNDIYYTSDDSPTTFRKKTFKNKYENNVLTSKLKFEKYYYCVECQKLINLYDVSTNFRNIKNDIMWVSCSENH